MSEEQNKTSQKRSNATMVSTRQLPEKEPPAGVPTRRCKPLSCREVVRAERAERAEWHAQAMQANLPVQEDAQPSTPPPLRTQPSPPSLSGGLSPPKRCSPRLQQRGSQEDPDDDGVDVAVAAIYYGEEDVNDVKLAAVGGVHCSNDVNNDDNSGNEEWVRRDMVPGGKTTGETEDDQPEENNEDNNELTITRLDVKSKSKMSDADLCKYFNSELHKKGSSDCGNRDCNCLKILSNGQVRSAVSRYLSWFWRRPSRYERDMILFEWYKYSSFVKKSGQGCLRFHNYCLPYMDNGTEPVPETVRKHLVCTKGLQTILGYGKNSFLRMSREAMCSSVLPPHKATGKANYNSIEKDQKKA